VRVLVTGASGFVGGHLAQTCADAGEHVVALSRSGRAPAGAAVACDLLDADAARAAVRAAAPDAVHHLAALASTGFGRYVCTGADSTGGRRARAVRGRDAAPNRRK